MKGDGGPSIGTRLARVGGLYLLTQLASYLVLQASCSPSTVASLWRYGALGPLAAREAIPQFQYHSWIGNAGFVVWSLLVFVAPFAYVVRPSRWMLVVSALALAVWCLFGLGFSIDHM